MDNLDFMTDEYGVLSKLVGGGGSWGGGGSCRGSGGGGGSCRGSGGDSFL